MHNNGGCMFMKEFYKNCQVFTPKDIVDFMLNTIEYNSSLFGKKVLENSCGDGNILVEIVKMYINTSLAEGYSIKEIKNGLEKDIYAYEIDSRHLQKCLERLNNEVKNFGIKNVNWKIFESDFLKEDIQMRFDYIIGNPPYISYSDLDIETRIYIKSNFISCEEGKPDYYYAFIEKSLSILNQSGKLVYLIPNNIFKNRFGQQIRELILPKIRGIIDYDDIKLFNKKLTTSSIIICDNEEVNNIKYRNMSKHIEYNINKESLENKWFFNNLNENIEYDNTFGDNYDVFISIATLLNEAFVLKEFEENEQYIIVGEDSIEKEIVRDAASPRGLTLNKKEKIIFPYNYHNGKLVRIGSKFQKKYPGTFQYLNRFREKLDKRKKDVSAQWYEYGRSQALSHLNQEKLLMSTIISKQVIINRLDENVIPYSGIVITSKENNDLNRAIEILTSQRFIDYVNIVGIKSNGTSVRISVNDIKNYRY